MKETYIQVYWTCPSLDEARKVSRYLVQKRLVACANIIPWVESIFRWKDQLDTGQETKVIFKTKSECFEDVKKVILKKSKYEVPEILKVPITGGNEAYLDWIDKSTSLD
ncbi:MAG: divalent-cation tolerance protein CutA [Chlamydiales bacterium]